MYAPVKANLAILAAGEGGQAINFVKGGVAQPVYGRLEVDGDVYAVEVALERRCHLSHGHCAAFNPGCSLFTALAMRQATFSSSCDGVAISFSTVAYSSA